MSSTSLLPAGAGPDPTTAEEAQTLLPLTRQDTDWLTVAQHIVSLFHPPDTGRQDSALSNVYRVHKVLQSLANGNYIETAVQAAGISKQTFYNWKTQAESGNIAAIAFLDAVEKARAEAESSIVEDVRKAARKEQFWAAGITLLERTRPERFGRRVDAEGGPKVVVQVGIGADSVQGLAISVVSPPTFAPDDINQDTANSLTGMAYALPSSPIIRNYVNKPEAGENAQDGAALTEVGDR